MKIVETRRRRKAHEQKVKRAKRRAVWDYSSLETYSVDPSDVQLVCHPVTPGRPPPDLYPLIPISSAMMTLYTSLMRRP